MGGAEGLPNPGLSNPTSPHVSNAAAGAMLSSPDPIAPGETRFVCTPLQSGELPDLLEDDMQEDLDKTEHDSLSSLPGKVCTVMCYIDDCKQMFKVFSVQYFCG